MKERIAILFGGMSVEHEISILSALQAAHAIDPLLFDIIPVYIAKDGTFYSDNILFDLDIFKDLDAIEEKLEAMTLITRKHHHYIVPVKKHLRKREIPFDIAFPILHGTNGEDGSLQGYLKTLQIPYVGCDVLGGAIGQDKAIMKMVLQDQGIPVTPWFYWTSEQSREDELFDQIERIKYPIIIKPANLGSSIGIHIAHSAGDVLEMLEDAFHYDRKVVIEHALEELREINASVLYHDQEIHVSVLEEVMKEDNILSYRDKYIGNEKGMGSKGMRNASRRVPADLNEGLTEAIQNYAKETYDVLEAGGVARIDFLLDKHDRIYVNEINTIPGSLSSYLWEASDISFTELITILLKEAIQTYRIQHRRTMTFNTNILKQYYEGVKIGAKQKRQ